MKQYVEEAKVMYKNFEKALANATSIADAAKECEYESYCYDSWLYQTFNEVEVSINLTGEQIIAVTVCVDYMTGELHLRGDCEVVNPETDDWDGEVYTF